MRAIQVRRFCTSQPAIKHLEPGLIHVPGALSPKTQIELMNATIKKGFHENGFMNTKDNTKQLNSTEYRGRMYEAINNLPSIYKDIITDKIAPIIKTDPSLSFLIPTHVLMLYYKTLEEAPSRGYIPWHQDNGENDGNESYPVISISLGDTCDFLIAHEKPKVARGTSMAHPANLAHKVSFKSGDILIFGGPNRYIWHSIYKIHPDSAPDFLPMKELPFIGGRFNFTFRHTPNLEGYEQRFATRSAEELAKEPPENNPFYNTKKMK